MHQELNAHLQNGTWTLVAPRPHMNIAGYKWVFKQKWKADGSIDCYKPYAVAKGFNQQKGIGYGETFSPVIKPCTINIVLSIAISLNCHIHQLDIQNAFFHGILGKEVYMKQPPDLWIPNFQYMHVCQLHKSLYQLKQAPWAWYHWLSTFLIQIGFMGSNILICVDDIIITGSQMGCIQEIITRLNSLFAFKDFGSLSYFLRVKAILSS